MAFQEKLDDDLIEFIKVQPMFFTGTAPNEGRINISPKGMDTFRVLDKETVAYLDLTGSGNETSAHIGQNGRFTIMMCSFGRKPLILRLYGRGRVLDADHPDWDSTLAKFEKLPGYRQIILLDIESVQTSCGYAVPLADEMRERETLIGYARNKGEETLAEYRLEKNAKSIDGLAVKVPDPGIVRGV